MGDELGGQVLVVGGDELGCPAPALRGGDERLDVRDGPAQLRLHRCVERERLAVGLVPARPAASGCQRHDRFGPSARRELQRDEAAERVADDMRGRKTGGIHRPLDRIGDRRRIDRALQRRSAGVADQRRRQHVVVALQRRQHQLPAPPRVGEAVQAHQRRTGAAAMRGGEARDHARRVGRASQPRTVKPIGL